MSAAHINGLHGPHTSFRPVRADDGKGTLSDRHSKRCNPCGETIDFYQSLGKYNIANKVFEQEVNGSWLYRMWSTARTRSTKRILPDDPDNESPDWNKRPKLGDWDDNDRRLEFELKQVICEMGHLSLSTCPEEPQNDQ